MGGDTLGRRKNFLDATVTRQMMIYFWKTGFKQTTVRELANLTGLKNQSLYNAFGNKEQIYQIVLDSYVKFASNYVDQIMAETTTNEAKLERLLVMNWLEDDLPAGCMIISSFNEFEQISPSLQEIAEKLFDKLRQSFKTILLKMKVENVVDTAEMLLTPHNGIQSAVAFHTDTDNIQKITKQTIQLINQERGTSYETTI